MALYKLETPRTVMYARAEEHIHEIIALGRKTSALACEPAYEVTRVKGEGQLFLDATQKGLELRVASDFVVHIGPIAVFLDLQRVLPNRAEGKLYFGKPPRGKSFHVPFDVMQGIRGYTVPKLMELAKKIPIPLNKP